MNEILHFKVFEADAEVKHTGGLIVRLHYPETPELIDKRIEENLPWGTQVFSELLSTGKAKIADPQNPIKPASGGAMYVFKDGKFIVHRRDSRAPTHPLYHGVGTGFTNTKEGIYTREGLEETVLREAGEETLLITRGEKPQLIVPNHTRPYTLETARKLGLDVDAMGIRDIKSSFDAHPTDRLEVYNSTGQLLFSYDCFLDMIYESQVSLTAMQILHLDIHSDEVYPIDAEGMDKGGEFIHHNRESYILHPDEIPSQFGKPLPEQTRSYQTKIEDGIPSVHKGTNPKILGPDNIPVTSAHVWAPDDNVCRMMDAIHMVGYQDRWMTIELEKEQRKLNGTSLLPKEVLRE